eukprot:PLAT202.5.p1 GENE.PLAT202.5~~PLAT202.5.p1  ORF type:complete len:951 (-),score=501.46 PLAT202.5:84-2936(-)
MGLLTRAVALVMYIASAAATLVLLMALAPCAGSRVIFVVPLLLLVFWPMYAVFHARGKSWRGGGASSSERELEMAPLGSGADGSSSAAGVDAELASGAPRARRVCCGLGAAVGCVAVLSVILFIVLSVAALLLVDARAASSTPLVGQLSLPGLHGSVTVEWQDKLVPHITAEDEHDLAFAQGVVHAKLRFWQMEFQRRVGAGRVAEVAGEAALPIDRLMRTYGFYARAKDSVAALEGSEAMETLQAFADGVNAWMQSTDALPPQFSLLNFKPEPWKPADSLVWAKLMSLDLSGNMGDELDRWMLLTQRGLSRDRIDVLKPAFDLLNFPTILSADALFANGTAPGSDASADVSADASADASATSSADPDGAARRLADTQARTLLRSWEEAQRGSRLGSDVKRPFSFGVLSDDTLASAASNNWVISGSRTKSGKPLLCNDPHLRLSAPSIWLLMHTRTADGSLDAIGASFVGIPSVVLGHNKRIAWAATNTKADVQDLYVVEVNPTNPMEYRVGDGWQPLHKRVELIKVKGSDTVELEVKLTAQGPIMNDALDLDGQPLAMRWVSTDPSIIDTTLVSFLKLQKAANFADFRDALRSYVAPAQNMIYADVDGNIGYQIPGLIPIRAAGHDGSMPVPAAGNFTWQGFIPFDELPRSYNPPEGFIATANNQAVPPTYQHALTTDWSSGADGYRAKRITQLIEQGSPKHTVETMKSIQLDSVSLAFKDFMPVLRNLATDMLSEQAAAMRDRLLAWDGDTSIGSTLATDWAAWWLQLTRLAAKETGLDAWQEPVYILRALQATPQGVNGSDANCLTDGAADCKQWAARSLNAAAAQGPTGKWGVDLHAAHFQDLLLGDTLGCFVNREVAHGGDRYCVNVGAYELKPPYRMTAGPSYRHIADLSNLDNSVFLNPLAQDGNPLHTSEYSDMINLWSSGQYVEMKQAGYTTVSQLTLDKK